MPEKAKKALMKSAHKKGLKGKAAKSFAYATMNKLGMLKNHPKDTLPEKKEKE